VSKENFVRHHLDLFVVLLSVLVQIPLAIFLGHYYDQRSFLDTGYLVYNGLNPYQLHNITVFSNPDLIGTNPIIGYPPIWSLLAGAIYGLTYNIVPSIFLYNFALKIPIIVANVCLAYLTRAVIRQQRAPEKTARAAWLFLLFNPLILLTTTAWGEFDTLIALLCVASLYFLSKGMVVKSGSMIALSIVLKPISFPLLGLPLMYPPCRNRKKILFYLGILFLMVALFWLLPFNAFGWMAPESSGQVTSYFRMAGGMTPFNFVEIIQNTVTLPSALFFLGYLWIPALLIGYIIVFRNPPKSFNELAEKAVALLLIFMLTRTWLSEPNIVLVIALALIAFSFKKKGFGDFHFLWGVPLIFMIVNTSLFQLFFLVYPPIIPVLAQWDLTIRTARLILRFLVGIVFQIFAWRLTIKLLRNKRLNHD
jgi:Glycosyltransferase family 87